MGMTGRVQARWDEVNQKHLDSHERTERRRGRARRRVQGGSHDAAVGRARARRLSGDPWRGERGHHHRGLDPLGARACAGRAGRSRTGRASSAPARAGSACASCSRAFPERADALPLRNPVSTLSRRERRPRSAGRPALGRQRTSRSLSRAAARSASSARAPPASRRWPAALVGVWPPARGSVRLDGAALDQWSPAALGPAHRLSAAGRRAVRRAPSAQNIARFEADADPEAIIAAAEAGRRARPDRAAAAGLRDAHRRGRDGALGRPAPAHRARAGALPRSVPGRAGRAQLEPRWRRRAGAHPGDRGRAGARRHRRS